MLEQTWSDDNILNNIKGISQTSLSRYLSYQEFGFTDEDKLGSILSKLTEDEV